LGLFNSCVLKIYFKPLLAQWRCGRGSLSRNKSWWRWFKQFIVQGLGSLRTWECLSCQSTM
jgi:hypothetical protein